MTGSFLAPPVWTSEELTHERDKAEDSFRSQRRDEGPARYAATFNEVAPVVADALARAELWGRDLENALLQDDRLWHTLRYFCGPEISEEDFWTLVGKKSRRMPSSVAGDAANVLGELVDPFRLPWLAESREPTTSELQAAILATSTLVAHQRLRTERRGSAARRQEDDVADSLLAAGYTPAAVCGAPNDQADRRPAAGGLCKRAEDRRRQVRRSCEATRRETAGDRVQGVEWAEELVEATAPGSRGEGRQVADVVW